MMTFQTFIPTRLSQIVKSFWYLKISDLTEKCYTEKILPDGHHEIIFHLSGGNAKRRNDNAGWVKEPDAFFAGQTENSYSLELKNNSELYGIRFYPHTLNLLFGFPADITTNSMLPLREIREANVLMNCISENREETFMNFETVLLQMCKAVDISKNKFSYIHHSIGKIFQYNGCIKIDRLVEETGVSQRYFDTLFRQTVGITPKSFCNIIKLNHFISYRNNHPHKNLTECCHQTNFFDQSHLIKLFRAASGQSPKEYFTDLNHINNYFLEM